ncbi:MAG: tetratricopeptide repeat protein [Flavobacteriales bacterium]
MKKLLVLFLLSLYCAVSFAQNNADSLFAKAKQKEKEKSYTSACMLAEKAIKTGPAKMEYYFFKADMEFELKEYTKAYQTYHAAVGAFQGKSRPVFELGEFFRQINRTDSSVYHITKAMKMAEHDSLKEKYTIGRGVTYTYAQKYKKAEKDFKSVLKQNPKSVNGLFALSFLYTMKREQQKAIPILKKVIELDSNAANAYVNLGLMYTQMDSLPQALYCYEKAAAKDPENALLLSNRGECYYKLGQYEKALTDINHSMALYPTNSWVYKNRAKVYIAQGRFIDACADLEKSESLGYTYNYDNEVKELIGKHCK